jgi:excisionase family DNA binding protein
MDATDNSTNIQLLTIQELCAKYRLSISTIHRLKDQGKIPFYQPAGKRGKLLFPLNAIERPTFEEGGPSSPDSRPDNNHPHLSGPSPTWMRPSSV